jgi:hypothetical protein
MLSIYPFFTPSFNKFGADCQPCAATARIVGLGRVGDCTIDVFHHHFGIAKPDVHAGRLGEHGLGLYA